jgi:hypothetical protein
VRERESGAESARHTKWVKFKRRSAEFSLFNHTIGNYQTNIRSAMPQKGTFCLSARTVND